MVDKPWGFFERTEMPTAGWWEALWPDPVGVLIKVGVKSDRDVIDLCSGDGWFTLQIAKHAHHVIAIDIDPALLEVARHRLAEGGVENCDLSRVMLTISGDFGPGRSISFFWQTLSTAFQIVCGWPAR